MSNRLKKTIVAQIPPEIIPAMGEVVTEAGQFAKGVVNKAETVGGEDHKGDKTDQGADYLNDLNSAQQAVREQFIGFGLDSNAVDLYTKKLMQMGMPSFMTAAKFLQDLSIIANTSSTTIQNIFPVAEAIYQRNIHSPERALAILRVIAKYEAKAPGMGLFDMAQHAASGNFNPQSLGVIRYSLMGVPGSKGNMNESRDLQQAFDGINAPNSELGAELNETNLAHQRMQATQESLLIQLRRINLEMEKKRDQKVTEILNTMSQQLPSWVKNNTLFLRSIMEGLKGVTMFNMIKNTAIHGMGINGESGLGTQPGGNTPPMGFIKASSERILKIAQTAGATPIDLSSGTTPGVTPSTGIPSNPIMPGVTPGVNPTGVAKNQEQLQYQNMQQANNGVVNDIAQQGLAAGVWSTQTTSEVSRLTAFIASCKAALDTNFTNLTQMIDAGMAGHSQFTSDIQGGAPYATPEQMEHYGQAADKNATVLIQAIQSLITIFVQTSASISTQQMASSGTGILQFAANMPNLKANYRSQLKDAQQMKIKIFDISVLGTIDQQVRLLEPTYQELKANIDMMKSFNNVGADAFVMPFVQVTQQMSALYFEASKKYQQASGRITAEPAMAQYCQQRAKQMEVAGTKARAEGVIALRELMKQQGGQAVASNNKKFIRLATEEILKKDEQINSEEAEDVKEVEAKPMPVDEYWDKLYKNNPPYGDVLVHPEQYRNQPTWKMRPKQQIKRLN